MPLNVAEHMLGLSGGAQGACQRAVPGGGFVGVLPKACQQSPLGAAAQGNASLPESQIDGAFFHPSGLLGRLYRQVLGSACLMSRAKPSSWAEAAQGRAVGQADQRAQLH